MNILVSEKEIKLTNDIIDIMEWELKRVPGISVPVLFSDFIPVVINRKYLTLEEVPEKEQEKAMMFRPILSGKAVQYLVDYLFDTEEDFKHLVIKKDTDKNRYTGTITTKSGNDIVLKDYIRETQLKFALFYKFYYDKDIKHDIIEINKFNNEHRDDKKRK